MTMERTKMAFAAVEKSIHRQINALERVKHDFVFA